MELGHYVMLSMKRRIKLEGVTSHSHLDCFTYRLITYRSPETSNIKLKVTAREVTVMKMDSEIIYVTLKVVLVSF